MKPIRPESIELLREIANLAELARGPIECNSDLQEYGLDWPEDHTNEDAEGLYLGWYLNNRANAVLERIAELATDAANRLQYLEEP